MYKLLLLIFCSFLISNSSYSDTSFCMDIKTAEEAKTLLMKKRFLINFCSDCLPEKANIRRIDIKNIDLVSKDYCYELNITGKIARGIKPPVFGGHCSEHLTVYNPSIELDVPYDHTIRLKNMYIWNSTAKVFTNMFDALNLNSSSICIKNLQIK